MDIVELGALGELIGGVGSAVGGIAVLATLIYLALQVRQNTSAIRASSSQEWANATSEIFMRIGGDLESARIWRIAQRDPEALDDDEWESATYMMMAACRIFDSALHQAELGTLDETTRAAMNTNIRESFELECYRKFWQGPRWSYSARLESFVAEECGIARAA